MFEQVTPAPADAIFGLIEDFRRDPDPHKINLGAGVYQDEAGATPILEAVKMAEAHLLDRERSKSYLPIDGLPDYRLQVRQLLLGEDHPTVAAGRTATAQTPGGTAAVRIAAELLRAVRPDATVWLSDETWVNHAAICRAAGLRSATYPYYDPASGGLRFDALEAHLEGLPPGDIVLLQGVCHNPTGVDPSPSQWHRLATTLAAGELLPVVDIAYQGFADGLEEDAAAVRLLTERLPEVVVCSSFSKSLALYNERVGALTVVAADRTGAEAVLSRVKTHARCSYSNPPSHGAAVAALVLGEAELRSLWKRELAAMRDRIATVRRRLAEGLDARGVELRPEGNGFIVAQRGMFSFTGLSPEQVDLLRERHSIYMVRSGRINVAGLNDGNLDRFCEAVAGVLTLP